MILKTQNDKFSPCGGFSQIASQICSTVHSHTYWLLGNFQKFYHIFHWEFSKKQKSNHFFGRKGKEDTGIPQKIDSFSTKMEIPISVTVFDIKDSEDF